MNAEGILTAELEAAAPAPPFLEVYRLYFSFVWRNTRALGVHQAAVDDVVQEVFVVVHRRLADFDGSSPMRPWLLGVTLNVVRHYRRSLFRKSPHAAMRDGPEDPDNLPALGRGPHDQAELSQGSRLLQALLDTLDEEKREVLALVELEEMTIPDVARALGINVNTAYSRLRLAREQFEASLARFRSRERGRPT